MIKRSKIILSTSLVFISLIVGFFCCYLACLQPVGAQTTSSDIIAVRIIKNPNHFSALKWYTDQGFQGSPQSIVVDGYEGVRDGRTVYVNVANVVHESTGDNLYTNIYLISYNQSADNSTVDIFAQILSHWKFNYNLVGSGHCRQDTTTECTEDEDCALGYFCDGLKARIIRDVRRLSDIAGANNKLASFKTKNGYFPKLKAGTYLPNISLSAWPSWNNEFSKELGTSLPTDPANALGKCPGYDNGTCWNEVTKKFVPPGLPDLPDNSLVYYYTYIPAQNNYKFCAVFESGLNFPGAPVCFTGDNVCLDFDGDGYGMPTSPKCKFSGEDCDDSNPSIGGGTCPSIYTTTTPPTTQPTTCFPQCTIGQANQCVAGSPNDYQVCGYDTNHCPVWQTQTCSGGQVCSGNGACITPCVAECTVAGQFKCTSSSGTSPGRQECVDSGGGCLKWKDAACMGTYVCRPSDNQCISPCLTDANCNPIGAPSNFDPTTVFVCPSNYNNILSCQVNGNGCWTTRTDACSTKISCGSGYTAICNPSTLPYPSCYCQLGACNQTCTASPGCLAPANHGNSLPTSDTCCVSGESCYTCPSGYAWNNILSDCELNCTSNCTSAGQSQCVGSNSFQTCTAVGSCLNWGATTTCPTSQTCSGGTCSCNSACSAGQSQCVGSNSFQTCTAVGSCFSWGATTTCSGSGICTGAGNCTSPLDTLPPTVAITSPSSPTYTSTSATIVVNGTAIDNVGVTNMTCTNSSGGNCTVVNTGTSWSTWSISNLTLGTGNNVITVNGTDAAGNIGTAIVTIIYNPGCTFSFTFPCTF